MRFSEIATITGGKLFGQDGDISEFVIDTRKLQAGDCFVAISGEHDGHQYVFDAINKGASLAMVEVRQAGDFSQLVVKDTVKALQSLAIWHRKNFSLPVIALTGSCGKTTVKEMIGQIFPEPSLATKGNYNNHIGVPLSVLRLNKAHQYAIFELGANHIGEIAETTAVAKPDVAYINNIAPAHIEGFGSIEGVLKAKSEIFQGLSANGVAVINIDDSRLEPLAKNLPHRVMTCSIESQDADVYASDLVLHDDGCYEFSCHVQGHSCKIRLQVPGRHNVSNAIGACAMTYAAGIDLPTIKHGLEAFLGVEGRLSEQTLANGVRLIDDTYNANVHSVKAAIDVLSSFPGKRILILGQLAEVGDEMMNHCQQIAEHLNQKGIDMLLTTGPFPEEGFALFNHQARHFECKQALVDSIDVQAPMTILVKGSRSAKMEEVAEKLRMK